MKTRFLSSLLCGVLLVPTQLFAWDHPPMPLRYRNQHPLFLQMPNLTPMPVDALPAGEGAWSVTPQYSNIFERAFDAAYDVRIDFEQLRTDIAFAQGLGNGFTAELQIPILTTGGGFLDPFLNWYHRLLGVPNAGRDLFPDNDFAFRITDLTTGANVYDVTPVGIGLGDVAVALRHETIPRRPGRPGLGWFAQVELPTGRASRGLGNNQIDYGFGILTDIASKRWSGFLNAGYFVSGGHPTIDQFLQHEYFSYVLGGAFQFSRRLAAQIQIHGGTPQLTGISHRQWHDFPLDIVFGIGGDYPAALGEDTLFWQLAFSEDLHADGPSIDFTAIAQLGLRWQGL